LGSLSMWHCGGIPFLVADEEVACREGQNQRQAVIWRTASATFLAPPGIKKKKLDSFLFEREKKLDSCFRRKPEPRELVREAIILTRKNTRQLPRETIVGPWIRGLRA